MTSKQLKVLILEANLETINSQELDEVCVNALIEFADAISECIEPDKVRAKLVSSDRDTKIDGLFKIRGALRAWQVRQLAEQQAEMRAVELERQRQLAARPKRRRVEILGANA